MRSILFSISNPPCGTSERVHSHNSHDPASSRALPGYSPSTCTPLSFAANWAGLSPLKLQLPHTLWVHATPQIAQLTVPGVSPSIFSTQVWRLWRRSIASRKLLLQAAQGASTSIRHQWHQSAFLQWQERVVRSTLGHHLRYLWAWVYHWLSKWVFCDLE